MNKPLTVRQASSVGTRNAWGKEPRRGPAPIAGNAHRTIRVLLFSDRRCSEAWPASQPSDIASHYSRERLPIDRVLITRLFISALLRAGHDTLPEPAGFAVERSVEPGPVMLEGRIWRLQFQTRPTPTFELDLSLTLYDQQPSMILWTMDFPAEGTLPFWIGLGCKPDEMVPAALEELEAAALAQFRSEQFIQAIGGQAARKQAASADPEGSHKVVAASSWTTSEQGEITAAAHESGTPASARNVSGVNIRSATPVKRAERSRRVKNTVKAV